MITLIACMARNRVIGRSGDLPWRFKADLKHFRETTMGHTVVMGRKTYESVGKLPGRRVVVMSRRFRSFDPEVKTVNNRADVLRIPGEVFIAGGSQVYLTFLPVADKMMLTMLHQEVEGDAHFPTFDPADWETAVAWRGNRFSYIELDRKKCSDS